MANVSYGSISLLDISDIGEFSVYPMSNQPLTVVYDPNNNSYTPAWSATNALVITPVAYYAGKEVTTSTGVTYTWTRRYDSGSEATVVSGQNGEVIGADGSLNVSSNLLAQTTGTSPKILTYYVTAKYTDAKIGADLTAKGQITYSIISQATKIKRCVVTGETTFKYNGNRTLLGNEKIVLTGSVENVDISKWQYKNAQGDWTDYPVVTGQNTNRTSHTLNVYAAQENIFINDVATIRLLTNDANVFDIHCITKLYDGAAGDNNISAILSNENQLVPCTKDGAVISFGGCETTIHIYNGDKEETSDWTITVNPASGITGTWDASTYTYNVTSMTVESGNIIFTCQKEGNADIVKAFSVNKSRAGNDGEDAVIYEVEAETLTIKKSAGNTTAYTPSSVVFRAYSKTGNNDRVTYSGRFKVYVNETLSDTTSNNATSYTYNPTGDLTQVKVELYEAGGVTKLLDSQTVIVVKDGEKGDDGTGISSTTVEYASGSSNTTAPTSGWGTSVPNVSVGNYLWSRTTYTYTNGASNKVVYSVSRNPVNGTDSTTVNIGNESCSVTCSTGRTTTAASTITIPFNAYIGNTRAACTVSTSSLPSGISVSSNTAATASADGTLVLAVASGANLGGTTTAYDVVNFSLTFTANSKTFEKVYTISKSVTGNTGASAVNVVMGNYADVIPCTNDGKAKSAVTIEIPYTGFYGTTQSYTYICGITGDINGANSSTKLTKQAVQTGTTSTAITRDTSKNINWTAATSTSEGKIYITIPQNAILGDSASIMTGTLTFKFRVTSGTSAPTTTTRGEFSCTYTWTKNNQALDGANAVLVDIWCPSGNVINNGANNVILTSRIMVGGSETDGTAYQWYQYKSSSVQTDKYDALSGQTSKSLTVTPDMVDGYASFRCNVTYGGVVYKTYYAVTDKNDPLSVSVFCNLGNQIVNSIGSGAVYALVTQSGYEIDQMPELVYTVADAKGNECYLINSTAKTVTYMTKSGSTWSATTEPWDCTYEWTFRDYEGNACEFNGSRTKTGKVIYVDGKLFNQKITFDVKVTK